MQMFSILQKILQLKRCIKIMPPSYRPVFWYQSWNDQIRPRRILKINLFFMSNPYKNKNLITSLMEIPELANFDQIATFKIHFESWDNFFFLMTLWTDIGMLQLLFQNRVILREPGVANFADIFKITILLIKPIFKNSIIFKGIRNNLLKHNSYLYS